MRRKLLIICAATVFLYQQTVARGVVLHPAGEPNLATMDKPDSNIVGRWGSNASCVPIAPNFVITTQHQSSTAGIDVVINGTTYNAEIGCIYII